MKRTNKVGGAVVVIDERIQHNHLDLLFARNGVQSKEIGKKFGLILHYLEAGPIRFNDLLRLMPKMTHATLSVQLKTLVNNGLVARKQYETIPPKVEYSLTEIGDKFHPVIEAMHNWGQEYIEFMKKDKE